MSDLQRLIEFAVHLADVAGEQILPRFRSSLGVDNKATAGRFDPVTIADREAEAAIRREIHRVYPDHGVLGEEQGFEQGASEYTWVIDPIDGTRAFILGQLHWGTLIALNDGSRPDHRRDASAVYRRNLRRIVAGDRATSRCRGAQVDGAEGDETRGRRRLRDRSDACSTRPSDGRHSTGSQRTRAPFVMAETATPRAWSLRAAPTSWWNAG